MSGGYSAFGQKQTWNFLGTPPRPPKWVESCSLDALIPRTAKYEESAVVLEVRFPLK